MEGVLSQLMVVKFYLVYYILNLLCVEIIIFTSKISIIDTIENIITLVRHNMITFTTAQEKRK